jgi:hypothetical protein
LTRLLPEKKRGIKRLTGDFVGDASILVSLIADVDHSQLRVVTGNSIDLGNAPPILARPNNRNCPNRVHIEKIAIDADK